MVRFYAVLLGLFASLVTALGTAMELKSAIWLTF
jgi:hypothetical protein